MNILSKVTWKGMWKNKTRTVVTVIGIILSAAMFMAVATLGYSLWDYLLRSEIYDSGDYFLRFDYTSKAHVTSLEEDPRVRKVGTLGILGYSSFTLDREDGHVSEEFCAVAAGDQIFYDSVTIQLEEGRLPQRNDELIITRNIYHYLQKDGRPCEVGQTITLDVVPEYEDYTGDIPLPSDGTAFSRDYTIVGIAGFFTRLNDQTLYLSHLLTFTDSRDTPLWYRAFVKTYLPQNAYRLMGEKPDGITASTNDAILSYYGATQYSNINTMIMLICSVLAAIIMVGSISLIYNAFSISVAERTKQFGLLSSVGATKKQIRRSVFSEAMLLSAIGIPLGLISGYIGIVITLGILSPRIHTMLSTGDGTILLHAVLSPLALAIAAVIALITVLISAAIPALRATRVAPIDAIRQKNDYAVPKKTVRTNKLVYLLFGLPGALSRKYYKVSKAKYRATVISLVISIVLFISAASISQLIHSTAERTVVAENYDMTCFGNEATLEKIRQQDFVEDSVYFAEGYYLASVPDSMLSKDFLECWEPIHKEYDQLDKNLHDVHLIYLEDSVFRQYLAENGLPEAPYFSDAVPSALVVSKNVTVYSHTSQAGEVDRYTYSYAPYDAEGEALQLLQDGVPSVLDPFQGSTPGGRTYDYYTTEEGDPILAIVPIVELENMGLMEDWDNRIEYLIRWDTADSGITTASYYRRDPATGAAAETPEATQEMDTPRIQIGATVQDLPFGVSYYTTNSYFYNSLILPLSTAPEQLHSEPALCITVSDYPAAKAYMEANLTMHNYRDYRENEENNRTLILLINVFSYGFIVLISLICVANVFNTISTNVALRKRDFGMLRSTGFRERDLIRMMSFECLTYGFKALLWGIPISLLVSYLIYRIEVSSASVSFAPPWNALLITVLFVFIVVFATMFYAVRRLRKDDLAESLRAENI